MAFESAPVGMAVTTDQGVLVQANQALADLLGHPVAALLGRRLEDVAAADAAPLITAGRAEMIASGQPRHTTDSRLQRADGAPVPVCLTCARVPPTGSSPGYLVVHVQDTSEQLATQAELTHRALHDPLTGLPNRALLVNRLEQALARLTRQPSTVAVLFADLDGFKLVNDTYGHTLGDQVLVAVARRLQHLQRPGDTACRYGGDEFVVLCEDSGRSQADSVATRIHAALATPIHCTLPPGRDGRPAPTVAVRLTASLGTATTTDPTTPAHQLLAEADRAMYRVKRPG
ncbi:MAG: diguanylate cyclase/phosphodiesterase (GGDEF & EAL domains) with PAS/PAC sensor(s) [uncultured Frankineae bacterium]|uniref:Diguanylate cyclase/phosphodiesterase (GGDEF & EAL domains) with PAS/PAC sensor(S) n=1 Tax=uncultured Frankineae bacterium TaxID=437475 RepID=A0A6J4LV27_9ACTN|nr:MAG: diguanylate cyclase/phosphodiesterase (GGDEF & EAL domains) with PAS/PAC sensor(s) [uncultured Frankineae bacterium]